MQRRAELVLEVGDSVQGAVTSAAREPASCRQPQIADRVGRRYVATPILGGFGPMPSAGVVRLHRAPEDPVPAIGDGMLLERLDDLAIEIFLRVAGPGSPLLAAELRHLGGALATPPAEAGARGHLEGNFLQFGVGIPGAPAPAAELGAHLDRYLAALAPWATGTRFTSFAERRRSLETCVPPAALARLAQIHRAVDPDRLSYHPTGSAESELPRGGERAVPAGRRVACGAIFGRELDALECSPARRSREPNDR